MNKRLLLVSIAVLVIAYLGLSYMLGITGTRLYKAITAIETDCVQYRSWMVDAIAHAHTDKEGYERNADLASQTIGVLSYKFGLDEGRLRSLALRKPVFKSIPDDPGDLGCGFFAVLRYMYIQSKAVDTSSQYLTEWGKIGSLNEQLLALAEKDTFDESEFLEVVERAYSVSAP